MPTVLSLGAEVLLPQLQLRPWGLFTDTVPELDLARQGTDRTALGARWMDRDALAISLTEYDCDTDDDVTVNTVVLTEHDTPGFMQHGTMRCSTISVGIDELDKWIGECAELSRSAALVQALTTQITTDHLNLVDDSTALAASQSMAEAFSVVEQGLASRILNGRGYIFVSPTLLAPAVSEAVVRVVDDRLVSPAGHWVVSDAGHASAVATTVFGTGPMGWAMTAVNTITGAIGTFDIDTNSVDATWVRYGLVAFNPAFSVKTAVTLP